MIIENKWYKERIEEEEEMKTSINDVHGTDRRYFINVGGERDEERVFEIAGYGVTRKDIEKERRFRELIEHAPSISFLIQDEKF